MTRSTEGREHVELHPNYRARSTHTIMLARFSEVIEILGTSKTPHDLYELGSRRCFLAIK